VCAFQPEGIESVVVGEVAVVVLTHAVSSSGSKASAAKPVRNSRDRRKVLLSPTVVPMLRCIFISWKVEGRPHCLTERYGSGVTKRTTGVMPHNTGS
jgi:hypothetical protein